MTPVVPTVVPTVNIDHYYLVIYNKTVLRFCFTKSQLLRWLDKLDAQQITYDVYEYTA